MHTPVVTIPPRAPESPRVFRNPLLVRNDTPYGKKATALVNDLWEKHKTGNMEISAEELHTRLFGEDYEVFVFRGDLFQDRIELIIFKDFSAIISAFSKPHHVKIPMVSLRLARSFTAREYRNDPDSACQFEVTPSTVPRDGRKGLRKKGTSQPVTFLNETSGPPTELDHIQQDFIAQLRGEVHWWTQYCPTPTEDLPPHICSFQRGDDAQKLVLERAVYRGLHAAVAKGFIKDKGVFSDLVVRVNAPSPQLDGSLCDFSAGVYSTTTSPRNDYRRAELAILSSIDADPEIVPHMHAGQSVFLGKLTESACFYQRSHPVPSAHECLAALGAVKALDPNFPIR